MATDNYNKSSGGKGPFYFVIALLVVAALGLTAVYVAGSNDADDLSAIESAAGDNNPAGGPAVDNDLDGTPDNQEVGDVNAIVDDVEDEFTDENDNGVDDSDEPIVDVDHPENESGTVAEEMYENTEDAVQDAYEETEEAVEETADDVEEQMEEDAEAANDPDRPTASDDMQN